MDDKTENLQKLKELAIGIRNLFTNPDSVPRLAHIGTDVEASAIGRTDSRDRIREKVDAVIRQLNPDVASLLDDSLIQQIFCDLRRAQVRDIYLHHYRNDPLARTRAEAALREEAVAAVELGGGCDRVDPLLPIAGGGRTKQKSKKSRRRRRRRSSKSRKRCGGRRSRRSRR